MTLAVAAASVVVAGVASPASASSQGASDEAAAAVIAAEDTIAGNAVVMEMADGAAGYESSANGVDVVIPMDPSSGITLMHEGARIEVKMLAADLASPLSQWVTFHGELL